MLEIQDLNLKMKTGVIETFSFPLTNYLIKIKDYLLRNIAERFNFLGLI